MRKLIAGINMTLDGYCDHTSMIADEELHNHYTELLRNSGAMLYGRITYQLMESYWPLLVQRPTGDASMDDFAMAMENIPKIVFSRTLVKLEWASATLAKGGIKDEILKLKAQPGKDLLVGSRSLIVAASNLGMVDEYQLCVHPVIAGSGLPLFHDIAERKALSLIKTKSFGSGAILMYYQPTGQ